MYSEDDLISLMSEPDFPKQPTVKEIADAELYAELARLRTAIEELAEGYEKSPHVYTNTLSISYHLRAILKGE